MRPTRRTLAAVASGVSGVAILVALANVLPPYYTELLTQVLIFGIFAMSLDLLVGYTGLPSLGHSAYFGSSAYIAAILWLRVTKTFWLTASVGLVVAVVIAALYNLLALRTSRAYYLMITLAFAQVLWSVAVSWTEVTGGDNGLPGLTRPELGPLFPWSLEDAVGYFYFVMLLFIGSTLALYVLVNSPFGYALRGIRENEARMQALGYKTWTYKYLVSLIAAFFAGLSGELYMYLSQFVSPSTLSVTVSAQGLLMVMIGAAGTLFGPLIGAVVLVFLQYVLSTYTDRWLIVMGVAYVLLALFAPQGALVTLKPGRAPLRFWSRH